jgi:hypothetical protein
MRLAADQNLTTQTSQQSQASQIAIWLAGANQALTAQSWDAAVAAASTVLNLEPANAEARAILVKAQEGLARKNRRASPVPRPPHPGQEIAAVTPIPSEVAPHPAPPPVRAEATSASVRIHFRSEVPEVTVIVYANRKEIFRKDFGGGGLFRRAQEPVDVSESRPIPTGTVEFLVSVTPHGRAAIAQKPSGNFPGGSSRDLEIHLSGPKELDVRLR